jgi:glycosyltransferase involved in cell wall biosynthesis
MGKFMLHNTVSQYNTVERRLPLNVLIFRTELFRYSETFIAEQGESLTQFQPHYLCFKHVFSDVLQNVSPILLSATYRYAEALFKLTGNLPRNWQIQLEEVAPILIHAHFGPDGLWAVPFARTLKIPLVVTFHGQDVTTRFYKYRFNEHGLFFELYKRRIHRAFKHASRCIAISKFIQQEAIKKGCPEDKICVHYIGVDTEKFKPDLRVKRQPIVLFVGRLVEKKGCEYIIKAIAEVQKIVPDVELIIIGDGTLRHSLEQQAQGCLNRFKFLGAQPPNIVQEWMHRSSVFCVPSITADSGDAEGLGIVFLEAQATGTPVVSSMSGGIPEAVLHNRTGFLAAEKNYQMLANYIVQLLKEPNLWKQFSTAARQHVTTSFDLQKQTSLLENLYFDVAHKHQLSDWI